MPKIKSHFLQKINKILQKIESLKKFLILFDLLISLPFWMLIRRSKVEISSISYKMLILIFCNICNTCTFNIFFSIFFKIYFWSLVKRDFRFSVKRDFRSSEFRSSDQMPFRLIEKLKFSGNDFEVWDHKNVKLKICSWHLCIKFQKRNKIFFFSFIAHLIYLVMFTTNAFYKNSKCVFIIRQFFFFNIN